MTTDDLVAVVLRARGMLRDWDEKTSASELLASLHATLAPLMQQKAALSEDAVRKLEEIRQVLDDADDALAGARRDTLDLLLLGLWVRVEFSGKTPHNS